jgi:alpha-D-ribose 1-methylphosphonate 5-triphosphate diphosphatase
MHAAFSLTNALAVFPDRVESCNLVVREGLVYRIGVAHAATARRIDCEGDFLLPGLIELHTDNLERHIEPRPGTFWSPDRAVLSHDAELAASGITTAFEAITLGGDTGPAIREQAYLDAITSLSNAHAQGLLRSEHLLHYRCELGSPRLLEQLSSAIRRGVPRLISLMEHVPGQGQWLDVDRFREYYSRRYGLGPNEIEALSARRKHDQAQFSSTNRHRVTEIARSRQCMLASHDDAIAGDVERAQRSGCTISEFPTSLEAARAARELGMHVVAGAPNLVRGGSHSGNVAAELLGKEGLIDILSSDYCPSSLLHGVFCLVRRASMPLHLATATATSIPASVMNLNDRGSIAEGKRADLVRVRETPSGPAVVAAWSAGRQVA